MRVLDMGDLDLYAELAAIPEVVRYLYQDTQTREEAAARLARHGGKSAIAAEGDALSLALDLRSTGETIGHAALIWTNAVPRSGEVGYIIHPRHAGGAMRPKRRVRWWRSGSKGWGCTGSSRARMRATSRPSA